MFCSENQNELNFPSLIFFVVSVLTLAFLKTIFLLLIFSYDFSLYSYSFLILGCRSLILYVFFPNMSNKSAYFKHSLQVFKFYVFFLNSH